MFEFSIPCLIFLGIVGLVVAGIVYGNYLAEKRRKGMEEAAHLMGFTWLDKGVGPIGQTLGRFALSHRGHSTAAYNVLQGRIGSYDVTLMDYAYTTGSGKNRTTYRQTIAVIPNLGEELPDFELTPETFFDKVFQAFGYRDINFPEHPEFSRKYALRGPNEDHIRQVFTPETLEYFSSKPGYSVEAKSGCMLVYRRNQVCPPEQIPEFAAEAVRICSLFPTQSPPSATASQAEDEF